MGENLTKQMAVRMGLILKTIRPAIVAKAVAGFDTFMVGSKGPELSVFVDPNCIFRREVYLQAQPLVRSASLQLWIVMVGFLKPTSFTKAAAILMRADPTQALAADETTFDVAHEESGIKPAKSTPSAIKRAVQDNTRLL